MHRWLAFTPPLISLFWIIFILAADGGFCHPPRADEGTAAHLFQLTMLAQIPLVGVFVFTKGGKSFARVVPMLVLQLLAWAAAAMAAHFLT